jgi:SagB-type dehydrogenase family enzyme
VAEAIDARRSRRSFRDAPLDLPAVSQLLWGTAGVTDAESGYRATPSAGATYPLTTYLTVRAGGLEGHESGVYSYLENDHVLEARSSDPVHRRLREAAFDQRWVEQAPVIIAIAAIDERTTARYGERGRLRYVPMEAGHAGQNIYLQAEALDLGTVAVGAFDDRSVSTILGLGSDERPLYLFPVGHPA